MSTPGIVTYPLGGITYDAEDAAAYFSTRTSGVFSTEEDFAVTVAEGGGVAVTVSAGRAWMHVSRFSGQSVTLREAQTVTLPQADSYLPRIDRLVLRYDATARATTLTVLQGEAKTGPTAPDISRTELVYDLCLCQITRPAGQTALTTANLTDTRADSDLCGLMRDGVTALPIETLGEQAYDKSKQTAELCDKLLASYTGGYLGIWPVTLKADGWEDCTDVPGYAHKQTVALRAAREANVPSAVPTPETFSVAVSAGLAGVCETANGSVTFWAESVPEADIQMQVSLLGEAGKDAPQVDDSSVTPTNPWSAKHLVDMLCPPIKETGNPARASDPVPGYPLDVTASWEPTQEGTGDPGPENIRPITGRDSVTVTRQEDGLTTTLTLPSTVYGGSVDAATGEGQETWWLVTLNGQTESIGKIDLDGGEFEIYCGLDTGKLSVDDGNTVNCVCNQYVAHTREEVWHKSYGVAARNDYIRIYDPAYKTVEDFKAWLAAQYAAGTPVQVAYKLASPIPFSVTGGQDIPALDGVNTLTTDADSLTVTGRADPVRRVTALEDAVASMTNNE